MLIKIWSGGKRKKKSRRCTHSNKSILLEHVLILYKWRARRARTVVQSFSVSQSAKARRFVVASPCAPVCRVRKDSLSVSDPPCYYCFYLCLLDGALRCGTLWHKNRLIAFLSSALLSVHRTAHTAASPKPATAHERLCLFVLLHGQRDRRLD